MKEITPLNKSESDILHILLDYVQNKKHKMLKKITRLNKEVEQKKTELKILKKNSYKDRIKSNVADDLVAFDQVDLVDEMLKIFDEFYDSMDIHHWENLRYINLRNNKLSYNINYSIMLNSISFAVEATYYNGKINNNVDQVGMRPLMLTQREYTLKTAWELDLVETDEMIAKEKEMRDLQEESRKNANNADRLILAIESDNLKNRLITEILEYKMRNKEASEAERIDVLKPVCDVIVEELLID